MVVPCRGENCNESFSIKLNRTKHENLKKYGPPADVKTKIPLNEKVCTIIPWMVALLNLHINKNCEALEVVRLTEKEKEDIVNNKVCHIYLHKNPTMTDTLQNDIVQILMLLTSALNELKTKKYHQWCFLLILLFLK